MITFREEYTKAIAAIKDLEDNSKVILKPHWTTTARTLGAEVYSDYADSKDLIEEFIRIKREKNLTVFFYVTNINRVVLLQNLPQANQVESQWVKEHPYIKLIEL